MKWLVDHTNRVIHGPDLRGDCCTAASLEEIAGFYSLCKEREAVKLITWGYTRCADCNGGEPENGSADA